MHYLVDSMPLRLSAAPMASKPSPIMKINCKRGHWRVKACFIMAELFKIQLSTRPFQPSSIPEAPTFQFRQSYLILWLKSGRMLILIWIAVAFAIRRRAVLSLRRGSVLLPSNSAATSSKWILASTCSSMTMHVWYYFTEICSHLIFGPCILPVAYSWRISTQCMTLSRIRSVSAWTSTPRAKYTCTSRINYL